MNPSERGEEILPYMPRTFNKLHNQLPDDDGMSSKKTIKHGHTLQALELLIQQKYIANG